MHIDFTKCPYVIELLRSNFSLEQAMLLYRYERLSITVSVLHYNQFSVEQLEDLCKTMQSVRFVRHLEPNSINRLGDINRELNKLTDFLG